MTQQIVTINGHTYLETLDDQGNVIALEGRDPIPPPTPKNLQTKAVQAIQILKTGSATATQQQQALAIIIALLLNLNDD